MFKSKLCLVLTGKTIAEDMALVEQYRKYVDMLELRVDLLEENERLNVRSFPRLCGLPVILTIRRSADGGGFCEGEAARAMLFARALSNSDIDSPHKNFTYVDFESDFRVSSLEDATLAFGTKIIRSYHDMTGPVLDIHAKLEELRMTGYEIPKISFMPHSLEDVTNLFKQAKSLKPGKQILCAMGAYGTASRILAQRLNSFLSFTSVSADGNSGLGVLGHVDPVTLCDLYHFKHIDDNTKIFGITGFPLTATSSPLLHNRGYSDYKLNAVFVPFRADDIAHAVRFAEEAGIHGFSVTVPHKEAVLKHLTRIAERAMAIGACNTVVREPDGWAGYNTDAIGFQKALIEFLGEKSLKKYKVAIIGAGGAAKAVAYAVYELGAKACIFNRTLSKAKALAEQYGFRYALLIPENLRLLEEYSSIIIQTTSKGMGCQPPSTQESDPIYSYEFTGKEKVFDVIYTPEITPLMARAQESGCEVCNGYKMLRYQGEKQFELFTGIQAELG